MKEIENVKSKEYIEWLCEFSEFYPYFSSLTFVDLDDGVVSKEARSNVAKMYKLYAEVEKFAISHGADRISNTYEIEYEGIGYRLTRRAKNPKDILCSRTDTDSLSDAIDFKDIIILEEEREKQSNMESIMRSIEVLINHGVTEEEIRTMIDECINKEEVKKRTKSHI